MAKYGSPSVVISVSTASGATAMHPLTQYVDTINGFKINAMSQETHTFGDSWVENAYTGVRQVDDLTISGFYDDLATTGPHVLLGQTSCIGAEYQWEIDFGSSDLAHFNGVLISYARNPTRNELTRFEAVIKPSGAVTTAS